ncbi:MAG: site-specific DNA-methyltransferase [Acidobacteriia bacterium]|nr:site-specific DNA-methyltransferase [Terriglobia bacterium]
MPRKKGTGGTPAKRPIDRYEHRDKKRINNPPVGLVTPETDPVAPTHKTYDYVAPVPSVKPRQELDYDPHLDPQLVWAGKKEHTSFEVPTVSLHVHERIDPHTIIDAVRKRNGDALPVQPSLFETREENPPLREAIDFYRHAHGWSNRMIAGDSLLVMNSLLEKEGMAGQVQMVYLDPPYGIKYGSNFQPFVNKRDVRDGKDDDLTQEPEMIRAFRDTWELGIHSYLTYLRDRLLLARELLTETGSCFIQISDQNIHLVRSVMDEVFGIQNSVGLITFAKTTGQTAELLSGIADYLLWYAKDKSRVKYRQILKERDAGEEGTSQYVFAESPDGKTQRRLSLAELGDHSLLAPGWRVFAAKACTSQRPPGSFEVPVLGRVFTPGTGYWKTSLEGFKKLEAANRLFPIGSTLMYKRYFNDFPAFPISNIWQDVLMTGFSEPKKYVVQTSRKVAARCLLMTTDPGDLVLDPTCGSGTTAHVAEQWGRRWITCDTSRVAITLAKQRLMAADFDYYELAHPEEGVGSGFRYRTIPHIMLKSIANNPEIREGMSPELIDATIARHAEQETLTDQPYVEKSRVRVTGPFTIEAVPAPTVKSLDEIQAPPMSADASIVRSGPTLRHSEWRDELLKTGLRGKGGQHIDFSRVEPLAGTRWLHADAETKGKIPERVVISFGPEHSLLEQRQVELAWEEARTLSPKPAILVFAAFEFDPEAAKDIDGMTKDKTGMTFLTAQMNADMLTEDLKKKRASNQSFWLVGRPDIDFRQIAKGDHKGKWEVEVQGFDYYNTRTGTIESGDTSRIAMWLLDTDYDGRSLYPRQVFFPMASEDEGWAKLARNLRAEIDPDLIEGYRKTISLPFEPGDYKRIAVKLIDDRGIESLKVVEVK